MKAAVYTRYGSPSVVEIKNVEKPTPRPGEVLVKIHASTVSSADSRARSLNMPRGFGPFARLAFGLISPRNKILGVDFAGEVEAVGKNVTRFKKSDRVFGLTGMTFGSHAEYKCVPQDAAIAIMPSNLSFNEAVAIPFGGTTAVTFLRDRAKVVRGESVLVVGASGAVGSAAIQLAKHLGAHVTAVCSTVNIELVKSLGADDVIDYTQEHAGQSGKTYDVILDAVGEATYQRCKPLLNANGRLILIVAGLTDLLTASLVTRSSTHRVFAGSANERADDLQYLAKLAEAGTFKPVIDEVFPLKKIVAAHIRVDSGRKRGNMIVSMT